MALASYGPSRVSKDYSQLLSDIQEVKKIFEVENEELPIRGLYITEDKKLNIDFEI